MLGQVVPQGINYQAVALDQQGQPIPGVDIVGRPIDDAEIGVRISILEASPTGNVLYQEEHEVLTDQYGMFNLTIGQGLQVSADAFNTINWQGDKFLQVELSIENDGAFTLSAVQQLMSVPYAFLADRALNVDDADADPANEIQTLSVSGDSLSLSNGNTVQLPAIDDADADPLNEIQNLSISGDSLTISAGNSVLLPTSHDFDKDSTNELQQLYVKDDSLFLSQDTSGIGYAINQNGKELIDVEFDKNCFPVPYLDSIPLHPTEFLKRVFIQEFQKTIVVSAYSDVTLVLDSNGNRLAKHNIGFSYGDNWDATPFFNNNVVYRDGAYFTGLRINKNGSDTVGTTIISDSSYILVLNANGAYQNHFSLDSMYANGNTSVRISAISGADIYVQCNKNNIVKSFRLNVNSGSFSYIPLQNDQIPLFTTNNEYWAGISSGSDSCLAFSSINNGTKTIKYYSDTSLYIALFFQDYFLRQQQSNFWLTQRLFPTKSYSALFRFPGELYSSRNTSFYGKSYIDSTFHFVELPSLIASIGSSFGGDLEGVITYFSGTTMFEIRDMSTKANNLYNRPSLWFENNFLNLSHAWDSRLQYSFDISSNTFSQILKEPSFVKGLDIGLNLGSTLPASFQPFGNFVITPYGARGYCAESFYGGQYLIMHKDDFESVVIH